MSHKKSKHNMKLNQKYHSILVKVISSVIFALLFVFILIIAEGVWPNKVLTDSIYYVKMYLLMGLK